MSEDHNPELLAGGGQMAVKTEDMELVTEEIKVEEFDIPFDADEGEDSSVPIKKEQTTFVDTDVLKSEVEKSWRQIHSRLNISSRRWCPKMENWCPKIGSVQSMNICHQNLTM